MNALDVGIVVAVFFCAIAGYRLGLISGILYVLGVAVGLYLGALLLPPVISHFRASDGTGRLFVATLVLLGCAFLGQAVGLIVGTRLHGVIPVSVLRHADRVIGAGVGMSVVFVGIWMLLPSMADASGWPARQARNSRLARFVDQVFPRPPDTLQALRRLVGNNAFPQVFSSLGPSTDTGPPPADSGLSAQLQERVKASTVKVEGEACRSIQEGSGFAIATDLVLTNAHVVAGEHRTQVKLPRSGAFLPATVVAFDANRDLALLRVAGLNEPALPLAAASSSSAVGNKAAVFGHPGGQDPLKISPAIVSVNTRAKGRDLYDTHDTVRDLFILAADLRPGDSGGALVDQAGTVIGVAFAIASDRPGTAYALTAKEIRAILPLANSAQVLTGRCLTD